MNWAETLSICWNLIQKELKSLNICSIEEFMNCLFIDLFPILNKEKFVDSYEKLLDIENRLEIKIQQIIKKYKEEDYKTETNQIENDKDKNCLTSLLKEKYSKFNYKGEEFPFYEYFYYTDYLNEDYINKELEKIYRKISYITSISAK